MKLQFQCKSFLLSYGNVFSLCLTMVVHYAVIAVCHCLAAAVVRNFE